MPFFIVPLSSAIWSSVIATLPVASKSERLFICVSDLRNLKASSFKSPIAIVGFSYMSFRKSSLSSKNSSASVRVMTFAERASPSKSESSPKKISFAEYCEKNLFSGFTHAGYFNLSLINDKECAAFVCFKNYGTIFLICLCVKTRIQFFKFLGLKLYKQWYLLNN